MPNKKRMILIGSLFDKEIDRLAMQPWQRGCVDEQVNARAAIIAYAAIMRMMRCAE